MKYLEVRDKIKTGDMLLWTDHKGGGFRAIIERWIVRHGTASTYTHVGVAWVDNGRCWVMEITTKGCAPRLLSSVLPFDWAPAPKELSDDALKYAFSCFGVWIYNRWQAILGQLQRLVIGQDKEGQCAEFSLCVWDVDGIAPTNIATPGACATGALEVWNSSITRVSE